MVEWIVSSSVLILIVIALRTCFKGKISLKLQYAIWALVLLRLLIPVSFGSSDFSVANLTVQNETSITVIQPEKPSESIQADHPVPQPQTKPDRLPSQPITQNVPGMEENGFDLSAYMIHIVWGAGFIFVAGLFLLSNLRFKNKIMRSRSRLDVRKNNLDVYATGEIDTPCLFGIRNPAIYVTYPVADDQTLLRHTLEHEATHQRHGDHIWAVLRCVCLAIHWYNPLVWWAAFLSQRDAELACDEATIKRLGEEERAEYGRTLIGMTCQKKANVLITATTMTASKGGIKERILLIAKKPKMAVYTLIAVVLAASIAVGCTFTGAKDRNSGDLKGTKVFNSESEVTGMSVQALPAEFTLINTMYLSEMTQWALGFEYGETIDNNTLMDPGSNTFSVTLYYADGTEQTSYWDYATVDGVTYRIVREQPPACWKEIWFTEELVETLPIETDPIEADIPDDAPPENLPELFAKERDDNKVCIAVQPTGLVAEGGAYLYIIPEDQDTLLDLYTAAAATAHEYTHLDSNLQHVGWWLVYQNMWWQVAEDGTMFGTDQETANRVTIAGENSKKLYAFCDTAVKEAGIGDSVGPEDITEIKSATLYWNGKHTVTDEYALNKIEKWLKNAREESSASCWFTAQLVLQLENGETKIIAMATDDCAAWMSEGVVYRFGEITEDGIQGNEEFYALFAPAVIYEKSKEGMDAVDEYMRYLNWSRYANQIGHDETIALIDMIEAWAAEEPTYSRFGGAIGWITGLDGFFSDYYGLMLTRLYELAPAEFAWACLGNASDVNEKRTLESFAYQWNMTVEEVRAKLEADLSNNG